MTTPSGSLGPATSPNAAVERSSLIDYPCDFPIKVAGANTPELLPAVNHIAAALDPSFDPTTTTTRLSAKGNYLAVTLTVRATSKEQLDELYRSLSTHPLVKWAL
jgi:uncharacterized protein